MDSCVVVISPVVGPVGALLQAQLEEQVKALGELRQYFLVQEEWFCNQIAQLLVDVDPFQPELVLHYKHQCALEPLEDAAGSQNLAVRANVVLDFLADNLIKLTLSFQDY
jgi:hypothetical protein